MMREILFRGKDIHTGEWAYGHYFTTPYAGKNGEVSHYHFISQIDSFGGNKVGPETVGQFTGLTDKNGKRIFEGDIVKTHYFNAKNDEFIERVVFHNGRFCALYQEDTLKMWANLPDGVKHLPTDKTVYIEWCEVIGNIHDNPELLEGNNE